MKIEILSNKDKKTKIQFPYKIKYKTQKNVRSFNVGYYLTVHSLINLIQKDRFNQGDE